ncbi:leucine--tRNA ligase [Rickettsiales bacterium (ex Bugula neritina AB1)]|nr:leucine--tRNA ligase [Rickettsiales bacterium (ex Bugula neritina AB1)]
MRTKIFNFKKYEDKWKNFTPKKEEKVCKKKIYILGMWMYPSGYMHMGHVRSFMIVDIIARLFHLKDYKVFNPIGWDAFGLPAENAAKSYGIHPKEWTYSNIEKMKSQIKKCQFMFNWENEMFTCNKDYYKHQQKLLIRMFKDGYLINKEEYLNWDPVDKTVLANEQVIDGKGWRSGAFVEKKLMRQWFIKISDYAEILLKDLDKLKGKWPQKIIEMQKNWIGKKTGYIIKFQSCGEKFSCCEKDVEDIVIFTKSPHFINKVEFVVAAPDSKIGIDLYKSNKEIKEFIKNNPKIKNKKDYRGIFTGIYLINPYDFSSIPLYIGNYVEGNYGTGVVMGVPSVCENDELFAKNNSINIIHKNNINNYLDNVSQQDNDFTKKLLSENIIKNKTVYSLKDWCISRQRYWGTPMPFIFCENCYIVPNENFPIELEENMENHEKKKYINCPKCGNTNAYKETDTMDTFVDSSWYSWKFSSINSEDIFNESVKTTGTVDYYVGGPEHATTHLLYARYMGKILKKYNYINEDEPFRNLFTQGMILMKSYKDTIKNEYVFPKDVYEENNKFYTIKDKNPIKVGVYEKMSKSKKNIIDPLEIIDSYGVDTMRLFVMSDTPPGKDFIWNENNLQGCWRFINKIWNLNTNIQNLHQVGEVEALEDFVMNMFYRIVKNFENFEFNIGIAHMRIIINYIEEHWSKIDATKLKEIWQDFLKLFWCICPIVSMECLESWNNFNLTMPYVKESHQLNKYLLLICVNGKKIHEIEVNNNENEDIIKEKIFLIFPDLNLKKSKKIIFVKNKLINFVKN